MTTICCVCSKTKRDDSWELMPIPGDSLVSHGYCPKCFNEVKKDIYESSFFYTNTTVSDKG